MIIPNQSIGTSHTGPVWWIHPVPSLSQAGKAEPVLITKERCSYSSGWDATRSKGHRYERSDRRLLGAPGLTTRNKKLVVARMN